MIPTQRTHLCGTWTFRSTPGGPGCDIPIPSHWTHGTAWNLPESWSKIEEAWIERDLDLPTVKNGHRLRIRFDAVMLACRVFLDETEVGNHIGGFTPFTVDVTAHAGSRKRLCVHVTGPTKAALRNEAWLWPVSYYTDTEEGPMPAGIWQPVWLEEVPEVEISDWHYDCGEPGKPLRLWAAVTNHGTTESSVTVSADLDGRNLPGQSLRIPAGDRAEAFWSVDVTGLRRWSPESPHLLPLQFTAGSHVRKERLGLRSISIQGDRIALDGRPLTLIGISLVRHRISPHQWRRDHLRVMFRELRRLGFNAMRTHGSICPPVVLEVADEAGILVENQSALWSNPGPFLLAAEEAYANALTEQKAWIERDRNHPSVFAWDVENEYVRIDDRAIPWISKLLNEARLQDPTRPVIASGAGGWDEPDIYHQHCQQSVDILLQRWRARPKRKPHFVGEWWPDKDMFGSSGLIAHGMNHVGRLQIDPSAPDDLLIQSAELYARELARHRLLGASGTFPFSIETLIFRPLFAPGQPLTIPVDETDPVGFAFPDHHPNHTVCQLRRPFANPGWVPGPEVVLHEKVCAALAPALAGVLIGLRDEHRAVEPGGSLETTLVVCNDTPHPLDETLTLAIGSRPVLQIDLKLSAGEHYEQALSIPAPTNPGLHSLTAQRLNSTSDLGNLLVQPLLSALDGSVCGIGLSAAQQQAIESFGLRVTREVEMGGAWVLGDQAPLDPDALASHLAAGGRILALRQTSTPAWLPPMIGFSTSRVRNWHTDLPWGIAPVSRECTGQPWVTIRAPGHDILTDVIHDGRIGPWADSDGRVADDLYHRFTQIAYAGSVTALLGGPTDDTSALIEMRAGAGRFIGCQLDLRKEDPQARRIFSNLLRSILPPVEAVHPDRFRMGTAAELGMLDPGTALHAWVRGGGHLLVQLRPGDPSPWPVLPPPPGRWFAGIQDREGFCAGLAGSDLDLWRDQDRQTMVISFCLGRDKAPAHSSLNGLLPLGETDGWRDVVLAFDWKKDTAWAGIDLRGPLGTAAKEKTLGKGRIFVTTLALDAPTPCATRLREHFAARAGAAAVPNEALRPPARPLPPAILRGSADPTEPLGDWTQVPKPWQITKPVVLNSCSGGVDPQHHLALTWMLWDEEALYVAMLVLAPYHAFGTDTMLWLWSSAEVYIDVWQLILSGDPSGNARFGGCMPTGSLTLPGLRGSVTPLSALPSLPGLLPENFVKENQQPMLFRMQIPWAALERQAPNPGETLDIALGCGLPDPKQTGKRLGQLAAPAVKVYREPATYLACPILG